MSVARTSQKKARTPAGGPKAVQRRRKETLPARHERLDDAGFEVSKDEWFFGENLHVAVIVPRVGAPPLPHLAVAARSTPGNDMAAAAPILVEIAAVTQRRWPTLLDVIFDMGYSLREVLSWALPLALLGLFAVFDLSKTQRGVRRKGLMKQWPEWNGEPLCILRTNAMAEPQLPRLTAPVYQWDSYHLAYELLAHSLFRRLGEPTPNLKQRCECPARAGWARCPLHPPSLDLPAKPGMVVILGTPGKDIVGGPLCGKTVTLDTLDGLGRRQRDPVGTVGHFRSFRRRTSVERYFSYIKGLPHWRLGAIRVLNPAGDHLFKVFICVATNDRQLSRWRRPRFGRRLTPINYRHEALRLYRSQPCPPIHDYRRCPRCLARAREVKVGLR